MIMDTAMRYVTKMLSHGSFLYILVLINAIECHQLQKFLACKVIYQVHTSTQEQHAGNCSLKIIYFFFKLHLVEY
jgi:hypothetical protein